MKRNVMIAGLTSLVLLTASMQVIEGAPRPDGGKKEKGSNTESYRIETVFYSYANLLEDLESMESRDVRNHPVNWEVALRKQFFEDTYTFYSPAAPGEISDSKEIRKPVIYSSIMRIDRFYRKKLRSGEMNGFQVSEEFCALLDKAIILFHYDTEEFEASLKSSKSPQAMINAFSRVELVNSSSPE